MRVQAVHLFVLVIGIALQLDVVTMDTLTVVVYSCTVATVG